MIAAAEGRFRLTALPISVEAWGAAALSLVILGALAVGQLSQGDPSNGYLAERFLALGTSGHLLGTDQLGRDLLARALAGLGWSLGCAVAATAISGIIGTALGLIAAQFEGWPRSIVLQAVNMILAFPMLILAISVIAIAGQGFWPLVLTLGLIGWPLFTRITYAETRSLLARDYVRAARLMGARRAAILIGHVLPAIGPVLSVVIAFHIADVLIAESALSFLGIGAPLGQPTWGTMLAESRQYLFRAPQMLMVPAAAIVLVAVTANLAGDAIARALESGR
jgi:ABC-type dipeptide/oligopeptide/nickel transport system permease subunit